MNASLLGSWVRCETCEHVMHVSDGWRLKLHGPEHGFGWTCRDWSACNARRRRNRGHVWPGHSRNELHLFGPNVGQKGRA